MPESDEEEFSGSRPPADDKGPLNQDASSGNEPGAPSQSSATGDHAGGASDEKAAQLKTRNTDPDYLKFAGWGCVGCVGILLAIPLLIFFGWLIIALFPIFGYILAYALMNLDSHRR